MPDRNVNFEFTDYSVGKVRLSWLKKMFPDIRDENTVDGILDVDEFLFNVFDDIRHNWPRDESWIRNSSISKSIGIEAY